MNVLKNGPIQKSLVILDNFLDEFLSDCRMFERMIFWQQCDFIDILNPTMLHTVLLSVVQMKMNVLKNAPIPESLVILALTWWIFRVLSSGIKSWGSKASLFATLFKFLPIFGTPQSYAKYILENSQFGNIFWMKGVAKGESFDPHDFTIHILPVHNNALLLNDGKIWKLGCKYSSSHRI